MHPHRHRAPACKLRVLVMLNSWGEGDAGAQSLMGGLASALFSSNPDGGGVPESWCFSSTWVCVWRLGPKARESQTTSSTVTQCWDSLVRLWSLLVRVCQTVWLRKEMVFISLTDRASALVTASRSNLLRFLVLPLGTHLENHMPSPDAAWSEGRQWPPLSPMCDWDCDWAWESTFCGVYILLFSFLKFIYYFFENKTKNIIRAKRANNVSES